MKLLGVWFALEVSAGAALINQLQGAAAAIILVGGVVTAVPLIWRFTKPVRAARQSVEEIRDAVLGDDEHPGVREHNSRTDKRLTRIEQHIGLMANADAESVRAALSQWERRGRLPYVHPDDD